MNPNRKDNKPKQAENIMNPNRRGYETYEKSEP